MMQISVLMRLPKVNWSRKSGTSEYLTDPPTLKINLPNKGLIYFDICNVIKDALGCFHIYCMP